MQSSIQKAFQDALQVKQRLAASAEIQELIQAVAERMIAVLRGGGRVYFCGNGGSAADAQHLAAELTGRYYKDRPPLPAEALHVNTSFLTAVANDYSYEETFARLLRGWGRPGDLLWAMSTSGNSPNILRALDTARELGLITVGLTGESGGKMVGRCDYLIRVPSSDTPRIQEAHMLIGHTVCQLVEETLFGT
ncbi:MAG: D-sedoheptulose 7-phosphate isomerase [Bacteroidia bacterium]|nr:D-sedoheptulose 7-phosphate isomerase [Bacteroidia bacterium]